MTDVLAFLGEHGATITALVAVWRWTAQARAERERAARVATEAAAEATSALRTELEAERARCSKLATRLEAAERREAVLAQELVEVRASIAAAGHRPAGRGGA